MVKKYK